MTTEQMAKRIGISRRAIADHIKQLSISGRLVREGGRAHGVWKVVPVQQPQP